MNTETLNKKPVFTWREVSASTLEYFKGREESANIWIEKYCLKDTTKGEVLYHELNPDMMHRRLAKELYKIESRYKEPMSEDEIYHLLKDFEYISTYTNEYSEGVNNPCFTGDTLVSVADGRGYVTFKQLVEEGKDVEVYSESDNKVITIKTMRNPRVTAKNQAIYKITFTSGESIRATKNHKFYLLNNQKVELSELKKGQRLRCISRYKNSRGCGIMNRDSKLYGDLPDFTIRSITEDGVEDVYNGTVDLYHNYFVGNFNGKVGRETRLGSSIKVANCGENTPPFGLYLSLNLYGYISNKFLPNAVFEDELFIKHVNSAVRLADNIVDLKINRIEEQLKGTLSENEEGYWLGVKEKLIEQRRSKLSITGLADMMASLGIVYGSKESILFSEKLQQLLMTSAYEASIELAEERGHFPVWDTWDLKKSSFLTRMFNFSKNELLTTDIREKLFKFGRRNIAIFSQLKNTDVHFLTQSSLGLEPVDKPLFFEGNYGTKEIHKPFIDFFSNTTGIPFEKAKGILINLKEEELKTLFKKSPYFQPSTNDKDVRGEGIEMSIKKWTDSNNERFYKSKK